MSKESAAMSGYNDGWSGLPDRARDLFPITWRTARRAYREGYKLAEEDKGAGYDRRTLSPELSATPDQLALWKAQRAVQALRSVVLGHGDRDEALRLAREVLDPDGD